MAAYAEGLDILHHANVGKTSSTDDAETTPLRDPEYYQYDLDVARRWPRSGGAAASIASWLLDLTAAALLAGPELSEFSGRVSDSGEGRWTVMAADRRGRAGAGAQRGPLRAVRLARRGRLRRQAALGDALRVRRPRRAAGRSA